MTNNTPLRQLYPPVEPYNTGTLKVSDVHTIYFEECGNPQGKVAVFVHGGPGGGADRTDRGFFDPKAYRVVIFDQRGAGRSKPHANLVDNTTWHLVSDMEKIREHLKIEKWLVFGGSWGSTLALAYAETYPDRVTELVLRGIFLLRRSELLWFYQDGASQLYPDAWEHYLEPIPLVERFDMMSAYYRKLTSDNKEVRLKAAKAWSVWEGSTSKLITPLDFAAKYAMDEFADAFARIECHYFVHGGFFETDDQLLRNASKLSKIPTIIVQGRYDLVCPMRSAWDLHKVLPQSKLIIIPDAGHNSREPGTLNALIEATDSFRNK